MKFRLVRGSNLAPLSALTDGAVITRPADKPPPVNIVVLPPPDTERVEIEFSSAVKKRTDAARPFTVFPADKGGLRLGQGLYRVNAVAFGPSGVTGTGRVSFRVVIPGDGQLPAVPDHTP